MSVTLFPSIQPQSAMTDNDLALYKEVKWNFEGNMPVYKNRSPYIVEGKEAVLTWAWKTLNTPRFRYEIYSWDYGNDAQALIGQHFTDELKQSEAARYVRECLLINPYITGVSDVAVTFSDVKLTIKCKLITIYGEAELDV